MASPRHVLHALCRIIMISSYNIGKEKVFLEVARRARRPVAVTAAKMAILRLEDWPWDVPFDDVFTCDVSATNIYAVAWNWIGETWPYFRPNYQDIETFAHSCAPLALSVHCIVPGCACMNRAQKRLHCKCAARGPSALHVYWRGGADTR
jgi:hypothetical protein